MKKAKLITANRRQRGFTLIELMITIAMGAILATLAIPSFSNIINNNRTVAATNNLVTALSLTRSEATKRGLPVAVCASNAAQTDCDNTTSWNNGWIAFQDNGATVGDFDSATEAIIQRWPAATNSMSITSTAATFIRYLPSGAVDSAATARVFNILKSGCPTGQIQARTITIATLSGRSSLTKTACP